MVASVAARSFNSGYSFDGGGNSAAQWPRSMVNTGICVCPQGERMVVERFGKMVDIKSPGLFFAVPVVDKVAYRVDMRESAIEIPPQTTITKDNVSVMVSGCIYIQFVDAEKAAYGNANPIYAVTQFAQSTMRAAIGEMELDEILHARAQLNSIIKGAVQEGADPWGIKVLRYEITEVSPDEKIREAMDKQAAAERTRREKVLGAEGNKQEAELRSQGYKIQLTNESEGDLIKTENEARAFKIKAVLEAEGEAQAIAIKAKANAEAVQVMARALETEGGGAAASLGLAKEYVSMYGLMGSKSNTMFFSERPADMNALVAQAAAVLKSQFPGSSPLASAEAPVFEAAPKALESPPMSPLPVESDENKALENTPKY